MDQAFPSGSTKKMNEFQSPPRPSRPNTVLEVRHRADVHAAFHEFATGDVHIVDDELKAVQASVSLSELDAGARPWWWNGMRLGKRSLTSHVEIEVKADLFGIELLGSVDVADHDRHDLEIPSHRITVSPERFPRGRKHPTAQARSWSVTW